MSHTTDAVQEAAGFLLPLRTGPFDPNWSLSPSEWRRVATRRPLRKHVTVVRRLVDQLRPTVPFPKIDTFGAKAAWKIFRFLNCCHELHFVLIVNRYREFFVRCSRNFEALHAIVVQNLETDPANQQPVPPADPESQHVLRRRDQVVDALYRIAEYLVMRDDVDVVLLWQVTGRGPSTVHQSLSMDEIDGIQRLTWFSRDVLNVPIKRPRPPTRWTLHR